MKKTLSFVLILMLGISCFALADGVWMRQLPQYVYTNAVLLSNESYPEVRLTTQSLYQFFNTYDPQTPMFLCFPGPEGAYAVEFDLDYAYFLDVDNRIQYSYQMFNSDSFEEFINKAESDDYIILDGSDDVAVRIEPDRLRVHGMIATREFGRSSKLVFQISMNQLSDKMPMDTIINALTECGISEASRIQEAMSYRTYPDFSEYNTYTGMKMLHEYDFDYLLKITFPKISASAGNESVSATVYKYMYGELGLVYDMGEGRYADVSCKIDNNPYPIYRIEEGDPDAQPLTMPDGSIWYIILSGITENGNSSFAYASAPLDHQDYSEKDEYLTIHFDLNGVYWNSVEEFTRDLEQLFLHSFEGVSASSDPYVPGGDGVLTTTEDAAGSDPEAEVQEPDEANESWICPECGTENSGNFCMECGVARPVSEEWTCPGCGSVNNSKFCPECGTARP